MSLWTPLDGRKLVGMPTTMKASTIAGIAIPDSSLARDATAFVRDIESDLHTTHGIPEHKEAEVARTLPGYKRLNFCEAILASPFAK
jgi:hypothetical protein